MPTYQYACTACGEQTEAVQSFTDAALTECPACNGRLRKVFSAVGVVFKGSGFYKNDSRPTPKEGSAAKAESSTGDAAGKGSDGKGSDGKGSDGKGSDGKGSDGKGAEGKGKTGAAPAKTSDAGGAAAKPATKAPAATG